MMWPGSCEPEVRDAVEDAALARNRVRQDHIEGRQAVGGDDQQAVLVNGVDIAHLAAMDALKAREPGVVHGVGGYCVQACYHKPYAVDGKTDRWRPGSGAGPMGAAFGAAIGHQYDLGNEQRKARPSGEQFFISTFRVMGHVAKADGQVTTREIDAARSVMHSLHLDQEQVQVAIALFTEGKRPDFNLDAEMAALRASCQSRPHILRIFVEIQLRFALAGCDMAGDTRRLWRALPRWWVCLPQLFRAHGGRIAWRRAGGQRRGSRRTHCRRLPHAGGGRPRSPTKS